MPVNDDPAPRADAPRSGTSLVTVHGRSGTPGRTGRRGHAGDTDDIDDVQPPPRRASAPFMRSHPLHLLSLGFGTGLAPFAPGFTGSLFGWLSFVAFAPRLPAAATLALIVLGFVLGVIATGRTARALGGGRPRAIVWDHVVAIWLVMLVVTPATFSQQLAAFALFRLFDGGKPPPVRDLDHRLKGGFGIMVGDLVAAFLTLLVIATWRALFPTLR
ncbi:phosphatidylglycerophosphatase A family protein [Burkholderia plantarii]|uniref:phosphatidylglycerophosphatase A family protein n=1 Tax=Burkholderia plantarii TaxID=41899 RepID=UPI0018DE62C3|nr:phosphatidylglycerophosphatase A [Burkholderia plantarii]MBI0326354.1 phosphatidylglycerophosphatase A [Burkholderia plantarii]